MASKHRDEKAIAAVACPRCNAWIGKPCFVHGQPGTSTHGPAIHPERRAAWQEWKRQQEAKYTA